MSSIFKKTTLKPVPLLIAFSCGLLAALIQYFVAPIIHFNSANRLKDFIDFTLLTLPIVSCQLLIQTQLQPAFNVSQITTYGWLSSIFNVFALGIIVSVFNPDVKFDWVIMVGMASAALIFSMLASAFITRLKGSAQKRYDLLDDEVD